MASDTGITRVTAESWLSVLQASHLVFLLQPWFTNLSKRFIKTPKLYFCDPGLAAWFLGVRNAGPALSAFNVIGYASLAPDGRELVFSAAGTTQQIWRVPVLCSE